MGETIGVRKKAGRRKQRGETGTGFDASEDRAETGTGMETERGTMTGTETGTATGAGTMTGTGRHCYLASDGTGREK